MAYADLNSEDRLVQQRFTHHLPAQYDPSRIDFAKLRDEFDKRVQHKATAIADIRALVEAKLARMMPGLHLAVAVLRCRR